MLWNTDVINGVLVFIAFGLLPWHPVLATICFLAAGFLHYMANK